MTTSKLAEYKKQGLITDEEELRLAIEENELSDCCGARIINYTWCKDCMENI